MQGVAVVGDIDSGVPVPGGANVTFDQFTQLLLPTLGIALLAYPDSFLTARSLSAAGGYTLDANREFLPVGASNVASGLLQGIPVNGSQSRSFVQADSGGQTNLVGLVCAVLVLLTLLLLTGLFEQLPLAVLAGIVIVAGIGLRAHARPAHRGRGVTAQGGSPAAGAADPQDRGYEPQGARRQADAVGVIALHDLRPRLPSRRSQVAGDRPSRSKGPTCPDSGIRPPRKPWLRAAR